MKVEDAFIESARHFLSKDYFPKIEKCLELLRDDDVWWRAHETDNSVGNLMLHLAGNVRQWIVSGIGGAADKRVRQKEFDQREALSKTELLARLRAAVDDADGVLASIDTAELLKPRFIQFTQQTPLQAIFHVVEHFGYHTGQIVYITKLRAGKDLGFYRFLEKQDEGTKGI
ncbi:MAG TPA: DinB family protein [Acidobacteriota bacterium]|jgi:uncharacterized damage-inducible protein DinB